MLTYHDMDPLYVCHMSCKQIFEYRSSKNTLHVCLICFRVMIWVPCMYAICPTNRSLSIEVEKRLICMPCMLPYVLQTDLSSIDVEERVVVNGGMVSSLVVNAGV